jgi:hypothetical protein
LNSLPEVKKFLKTPGHADAYHNLKVNFIFGRNPTLTLKSDEGDVLETIDLAPVSGIFLFAFLKIVL